MYEPKGAPALMYPVDDEVRMTSMASSLLHLDMQESREPWEVVNSLDIDSLASSRAANMPSIRRARID